MSNSFQILLLTDNDGDVELVRNQLIQLDLELNLEVVSSKKELSETIAADPPDLVVSDIDMSNNNGISLMDLIRQKYPDMPLIYLSSSEREKQAMNAMLEGTTDYVIKDHPFRLKPVVKQILTQEKAKINAESRHHFQLLVQSIDGIVWEADAETFEFYYVSPQTKRILGYPPSFWYQDKSFWKNHIHPDDRERAVRFYHHKSQQGENHTFEYRMITANGDIVWLRDMVTVVMKDGKPAKLRGLMIDITQQKEAEQQRDEAHNRLQEHVREQKCLNRITRLNEQELTVQELLSKVIHHLPEGWRYPEIATASITFDDQIFQSESYKETDWTLLSKTDQLDSGSLVVKVAYLEEKPIEDEGPFLKEERQLIDAITDILVLKIDRILSKKELKKKQRLLNRAYQMANLGSWELDILNSTLNWSSAIKKLHEVGKDYEPDPESAISFYKKGEDRKTIRKVVNEAIESGKPFDEELRIITAEGNERWVRVVGEAEFEDRKCIRIYGSTQNIDKRKKAEESLRLSEQRFKSLVQEGSDLIAIIDANGNYKDVVSTSERTSILGITADEFIGKNVFDYIHKEDRKRVREILSSLSCQEGAEIAPFRFRDAEGNWHWIETTITNMVDNPAICGFVTNSRDVTERIELLKAQEQFSDTIENIFRFVPEGLLVFTDKMNLFKKNKAMEDLIRKYAPRLGYAEEELMNELIKKVKENIRTNGKSEIKISRKNSSKFK